LNKAHREIHTYYSVFVSCMISWGVLAECISSYFVLLRAHNVHIIFA